MSEFHVLRGSDDIQQQIFVFDSFLPQSQQKKEFVSQFKKQNRQSIDMLKPPFETYFPYNLSIDVIFPQRRSFYKESVWGEWL